jgi:hypothetical protein
VRTLNIDLFDILNLVHAAEDFGYARSVLFGAFADMTSFVSDNEIIEYAESFLTEEAQIEGYTEEDHASAIEAITCWRNTYCIRESDL